MTANRQARGARSDGRGLYARDVMNPRVKTVREDDRVYDALQVLLKNGFSGAPVVGDGRRFLGVLSEHGCIQALMRAVMDHLPSSHVRDVMDRDVLTISSDAHVLDVAHLFLAHRARRLPVVDDGILVGILSRRDLLRAASDVFRQAPSRHAASLYLSAFHDRSGKPPG